MMAAGMNEQMHIGYNHDKNTEEEEEKKGDLGLVGSLTYVNIDNSLNFQNLEIINDATVGEGTFGIVFKYRHKLKHDQIYCVKEFRMYQDPQEKRRLEREVEHLKILSHKNILRLYNEFSDPNQNVQQDSKGKYINHYLVLEYLSEGNLFNFMNTNKSLTEQAISKIFCDIAEGLEYLHQKNLAHRDLKPANIVQRADGSWVIIDFGLSICEDFDPMKSYYGTPNYMAPEFHIVEDLNRNIQVKEEYKKYVKLTKNSHFYTYDKQVDVFAFGAMLYELITRSLPFNFGPKKVLEITGNDTQLRNYTIDRDIFQSYPNIAEITYNCLKIDPNQRPKISEIRKTLKLMNHDIHIPNEGLFKGLELADIRQLPESCEFGFILRLINPKTHNRYLLKEMELHKKYENSEEFNNKPLNKLLNLVEKMDDFQKTIQDSLITKFLKVPIILPLQDWKIDIERNSLFLLYPDCAGGNLRTKLNQNLDLNNDNILKWIIQLHFSLKFLQHYNVKHYNIRPESIFFDENNNAMLGDFGLAELISISPYRRQNLHYLAPELCEKPQQGKKLKTYTTGCDWYSFGITLYEMVVGSYPFKGETVAQIRESINTSKLDMNSNKIFQTVQMLIIDMLNLEVKTRKNVQISKILYDVYFVRMLEKKDLIGKGGFGEVHLKFDTTGYFGGGNVAVKEIVCKSEDGDRVKTEYNKLEKYNMYGHKNIIKAYCLVQEDRQKYHMVLEYANMGDLQRIIWDRKRRRSYIPEEDIVYIAMEICEGLEFLHFENQQMHLDIKPQNILVFGPKGINGDAQEETKEINPLSNNMNMTIPGDLKGLRYKIADFGMARDEGSVTQSHFGGTYKYAGPERLFQNKKVFPSDMFSLGVTLYDLCMLKEPFGGTIIEIQEQIKKSNEIEITAYYSHYLKDLIKALMNPEYPKRPDARQTKQELSKIKELVSFPDANLKTIIQRIKTNMTPATLNLDCKINVETERLFFTDLTEALENNTSVQDLSLVDNSIKYDDEDQNYSVSNIAHLVQKNKHLKSLNLSGNFVFFTDENASVNFCSCLKKNSGLVQLKLRDTGLMNENIQFLLGKIANHPTLKVLDLSENTFFDHIALGYFGKAFEEEKLDNLQNLILSHCTTLKSKGIINLFNGLINHQHLTNCKLEELHLFNCDISQSGAIKIADLLIVPKCPILYLNLGKNGIFRAGILKLCESLKINQGFPPDRRLRYLNLYMNSCKESADWKRLTKKELAIFNNIVVTEENHISPKMLEEDFTNNSSHFSKWLIEENNNN